MAADEPLPDWMEEDDPTPAPWYVPKEEIPITSLIGFILTTVLMIGYTVAFMRTGGLPGYADRKGWNGKKRIKQAKEAAARKAEAAAAKVAARAYTPSSTGGSAKKKKKKAT